MNDFSWELVKKLALTNPLFWLFLIIAFISWAFYRQIVGFMGEVWTKEALSKLNKKERRLIFMFGFLYTLFMGGACAIKGIRDSIENEKYKQKY